MAVKVLVSDKLSEAGLEILRAAEEVELDVAVGLSPEELSERIGGYEAIIIRSATKLPASILEKAVSLKAIVRAGVGVDNVDLTAAKERGIAVMNTPGGSTSAVAELVLGMMLGLARRLPEADRTMKAGRWEKKSLQGTQLKDKTLGLIGLGRIGRTVAEYARAFGMTVIGYDPLVTEDIAGIERCDLDRVFREADYLSLHVPLTEETRHMVGTETLKKVKKGVRIINCARGGVVDEQALREALDDGRVAGAAFDVYETEPPGENSIASHPKVIATPHIGASTDEAQASVSTEAAAIIVEYARSGTFRNRLV
ncbi:MAG: hypothetical protein D6679_07665 [Candidatus Hydrogenedentota bacterium]|nr:MAG: hypothetical protein D6679_07665 [Candidatus Hydrogenedentota bacterium]